MKESSLRQVANSPLVSKTQHAGIITLLLKDHRAMRVLMKEVKSKHRPDKQIIASFKKLERLVLSHVKAEEKSLLVKIKDHPKFKHEAIEGIEEHEIHRTIIAGIHQVTDTYRRITRMKIFCEILEHHLNEEEEELFPDFKKYAALSTRKKIGEEFVQVRARTSRKQKLGALADS